MKTIRALRTQKLTEMDNVLLLQYCTRFITQGAPSMDIREMEMMLQSMLHSVEDMRMREMSQARREQYIAECKLLREEEEQERKRAEEARLRAVHRIYI